MDKKIEINGKIGIRELLANFPNPEIKEEIMVFIGSQQALKDGEMFSLLISLISIYRILLESIGVESHKIHSDILKEHEAVMEKMNRKLFGTYDTKLDDEAKNIKSLVDKLNDEVNRIATTYDEYFVSNQNKIAEKVTSSLKPVLDTVSKELIKNLKNANSELDNVVKSYRAKIEDLDNKDLRNHVNNSCKKEIEKINQSYKNEILSFTNIMFFEKRIIGFIGGLFLGTLIVSFLGVVLYLSTAKDETIENIRLKAISNASLYYLQNERSINREEARNNLYDLLKIQKDE